MNLDFHGAGRDERRVFSVPTSFYARWCLSPGADGLREAPADPPPEKLLQVIWQHQRLKRQSLRLVDGRSLRVLHPGFWNHEPGPDFRGAVIQIGAETPRSGDVELDQYPEDWRAHKHDVNPAFKGVTLHVVWACGSRGPGALPTLELNTALEAPMEQLSRWLPSEESGRLPEELAGQCCPCLREMTADEVQRMLHEAALARLQCKAAQLQARAHETGWEQALWEGLFRALGYKHNTWPMQCLAEQRSRLLAGVRGALQVQARLLGLAGLLPSDLARNRSAADSYVRQVWDFWWREQASFGEARLPKNIWRLAGLRPANNPQRRLALAAHWLTASDLPGQLEAWDKADGTAPRAAERLLKLLQAPPDPFWSWHWTLRSEKLRAAQPLLGAARVTDLAMNVILPWLWVRAVEAQRDDVRQRVEAHYQNWPAGEDNAVLKLARGRLLGNTTVRQLKTAAAQQGLLQITRDFCAHSNALCQECRFPELVRQWLAQQRGETKK
ncbi:MAG: DUF2851 family protein [Verrucomicrobiota bacterium]